MPKKVPVMLLSGSFAVTLQCSHQCDHSVPGSENLKGTKAMYQRCSKSVHLQCPRSVPAVYCFGKIWGTSGNTASTFQMSQVLLFSCHVLAMSPEFPQKRYTAGTLPGHCKCTDLEHLWYIPLVLSEFPSPVHCDHTDGNTANSLQMSHSETSLVLSLDNLKVYPQFT